MSAARLGIQRLDDRLLHLGFNLFERLGSSFLVQSLEDGLALVGSQILNDVGDVGGMQFGEAIVRNLELYPARRISLDHVDEVPGNIARRDFVEQRMQGGAGRNSAQQPTDRAARSDVDGKHTQDGAS